MKLSTRPEKRVGSDAMWDHAEDVMTRVLEQIEEQSGGRIKTAINPGEGAFYGPKFEYVLRDAIGRDWQCGTTQVDFNLPERFGAFYVDADGEKKHARDGPPRHLRLDGALHRHPDRAFRRAFPALARARAGGGRDHHLGRRRLRQRGGGAARKAGLRVDADLRNEKINYKVREHSLAKVPVLLVVGRKEAAERTVSIRRLGSPDQTSMTLDDALKMLVAEAVTPDLRRAAEAVSEPEVHVTLDGHHVVERTLI